MIVVGIEREAKQLSQQKRISANKNDHIFMRQSRKGGCQLISTKEAM